MESITKPLALIVGGSSGLGFATANQLLERGIDTVIIGSSPAKLETAKHDLSGTGHVETLQANLYEASEQLPAPDQAHRGEPGFDARAEYRGARGAARR